MDKYLIIFSKEHEMLSRKYIIAKLHQMIRLLRAITVIFGRSVAMGNQRNGQ
jgi:hypothetical protein